MRKLFILAALISFSIVGLNAQKSNVSKAYNKSEAAENPDFSGAVEAIEAALQDPTTKDQARTWFVAGHVYFRMQELESTKGADMNEVARGEWAIKSTDYLLKAYDLDFIPDDKGKIKPKHNKKIVDYIYTYYNQMAYVNYGIKLYSNEDYEGALAAFERHLAVPTLKPIVEQKDYTPPTVDSLYYQISYYAGVCASLANNQDRATEIFEAIRNKGYEENKIHQFLYAIYTEKKDTANAVRILEEGIVRFPDEFYYLGSMINYYVETGQSESARIYLDKAIAREPNNPLYRTAKGNLFFDLKNYKEAQACYKKALDLDPNDADNWFRYGYAYFSEALYVDSSTLTIKDKKLYDEGRQEVNRLYSEALPYIEKSVELNPKNLDALKMLRSLYLRFGENAKYEEINNKIKSL